MTNSKYREKYVGMHHVNNQGETMKIVEYLSSNNILVEFEDGTIVNASVRNFKAGAVKNPNSPSVFGVGVVGVKYPINKNGKIIREYTVWHGMLERCYSERSKHNPRNRTYKDCVVDKGWLYFPNFYEWIHSQDNYDKWRLGGYSIDKDIIKKGNTVYSKEYCCLVPSYINNLFTKHGAARGKYPIGVLKGPYSFEVRVICMEKKYHLSGFDSEESAFNEYKRIKEEIIKQRASDEYANGRITKRCFDAMMSYCVEITD